MDAMSTSDEVFDRFWAPIVMRDGQWDVEQLKHELFDYHALLHEVPLVYDHVTGGRVSKPNTIAAAVMAEADDHYARLFESELAEQAEESNDIDEETRRHVHGGP